VASQGSIGERIKMLRKQRGLSQAQLAHPELSDSYVSLIESGKRTPTPAVLELIAQKLGCSLTYLINGVTNEELEEIELALRFARLALENGDLAEARRRYAELLEDRNLESLAAQRQDARFGYALATEACGDLAEAIDVLRSLRDEDTEGQTPERRIQISIALCRCYREFGALHEAVQVGEETLGLPKGRPEWNDDLIELGSTLLAAYIERGDLLRARQFSAELLSAAESLGTARAIVAACWNAAMIVGRIGCGDEALSLAERALAVQSENGEPRNLARLRAAYAVLLRQVRPAEAARARDLLLRALRELEESAAGAADVVSCLIDLARAEIQLGDPHAAAAHARAAAAKATGGMSSAVLAETHLVLGLACSLLGQNDQARAELDSAAEHLKRLPATRTLAEKWRAVAELRERIGDEEGCVADHQRALACVGL